MTALEEDKADLQRVFKLVSNQLQALEGHKRELFGGLRENTIETDRLARRVVALEALYSPGQEELLTSLTRRVLNLETRATGAQSPISADWEFDNHSVPSDMGSPP